MARRSSVLLFNPALQRKWLKWGKSVLRVAARPTKPLRQRPRQVPEKLMALRHTGARRYYVFDPGETAGEGRSPLLVMLHGCKQSAQQFSASTGMNRLAAQEGFMVLYPEQDKLAHGQGCWNWYGKSSGQPAREAISILGAIDHACTRYKIDPNKIMIAGFSSGASMAALVAQCDPARFAAVALHSGVDPALAHSTATALAAMRGSHRYANRPPAAAVQLLPPLLVLQGSADRVVVKVNGMRAASAWAARQNAEAGTPRVVRRGNRYPLTSMDWTVHGRLAATLSEISGLGHAWSGGAAAQEFSDPKGPNASRIVWAFAQRQFT